MRRSKSQTLAPSTALAPLHPSQPLAPKEALHRPPRHQLPAPSNGQVRASRLGTLPPASRVLRLWPACILKMRQPSKGPASMSVSNQSASNHGHNRRCNDHGPQLNCREVNPMVPRRCIKEKERQLQPLRLPQPYRLRRWFRALIRIDRERSLQMRSNKTSRGCISVLPRLLRTPLFPPPPRLRDIQMKSNVRQLPHRAHKVTRPHRHPFPPLVPLTRSFPLLALPRLPLPLP